MTLRQSTPQYGVVAADESLLMPCHELMSYGILFSPQVLRTRIRVVHHSLHAWHAAPGTSPRQTAHPLVRPALLVNTVPMLRGARPALPEQHPRVVSANVLPVPAPPAVGPACKCAAVTVHAWLNHYHHLIGIRVILRVLFASVLMPMEAKLVLSAISRLWALCPVASS